MADRPGAPRGLLVAGKRLWREVWAELPESMEFDAREVAILRAACRQVDANAALEREIKRDGVTVRGSTGQSRLHPAITEVRQGRLALGRLLGELQIPDAEETPRSAASRRGKRAATARWEQRRALREARGGAA